MRSGEMFRAEIAFLVGTCLIWRFAVDSVKADSPVGYKAYHNNITN